MKLSPASIRLSVLATAICIASALSSQAAELANLKGRFVVDGKPPAPTAIEPTKDQEVCSLHRIFDEGKIVDDKGGVANAVIMLKTKNVPVAPSYEATANAKVELDNRNCRFEPHVAVVRLSQTLEVKNSDPIGHNTNISPVKNPPINPILPANGEPVNYKFTEEEGTPVKVGCNIHPWMGAFIVARKDPYAAVSNTSGNFEIKDLPVGTELEFALWSEIPKELKGVAYKGGKADSKGRFKIKLKAGDNDLGDIKIPASMFN